MNDFVLFQSFLSEEEALPFIEIMKENEIEYQVEKFKEPLDGVIAGEIVRDQFYLKIKSLDFPKANKVIDKVILENISSIDKDYYLFSFSNDELLEVIKKPDEWSRQDFLIARKILDERGLTINDEEVNKIKSTRIKELAIQDKEPRGTIVAGYIFAFLFSIVGIFFGLAFLVTKKTLPDGSRVFAYNESTRNHGKAIFIISIAMIIFYIVNQSLILPFMYKFF